MNKEERIDRNIKMAEGNLKHEGMYLTDEERKLVKKVLMGEITHKQLKECLKENKQK